MTNLFVTILISEILLNILFKRNADLWEKCARMERTINKAFLENHEEVIRLIKNSRYIRKRGYRVIIVIKREPVQIAGQCKLRYTYLSISSSATMSIPSSFLKRS